MDPWTLGLNYLHHHPHPVPSTASWRDSEPFPALQALSVTVPRGRRFTLQGGSCLLGTADSCHLPRTPLSSTSRVLPRTHG